jgi:hypothetical protein
MGENEWFENSTGLNVEEIIKLESEYRVDSLVCAIEEVIMKKEEEGLDLKDYECVVLAVEAMEREVNNGGFLQFFSNSSYFHTPGLVESLSAINAVKTMEIAEMAISVLDLPQIEDDNIIHYFETIQEKILESTVKSKLHEMDALYFDNQEDIAQLLFDYIKSTIDLERQRVSEAARNILLNISRNYTKSASYQVVGDERIDQDSKLKIYSTLNELKQFGFIQAFIYENITFTENNGKFVPQYYCTSNLNPPIAITVYHLQPLDKCTVSCETNLSDGRVICTYNGGKAKHAPRPPEIVAQVLQEDAQIAQIIQTHREAVSENLKTSPDVTASIPLTPHELFLENERQMMIRYEYRRKIGFVTESQLVGIANGNTALAHEIYNEIQSMLSAGYDPYACECI